MLTMISLQAPQISLYLPQGEEWWERGEEYWNVRNERDVCLRLVGDECVKEEKGKDEGKRDSKREGMLARCERVTQG